MPFNGSLAIYLVRGRDTCGLQSLASVQTIEEEGTLYGVRIFSP